MDQVNINTSVAKALNIQDLPKESQEEIVQKMSEIVLERIMIEILEILEGEQKESFKSLVETGDHKKIGDFIKANVPDINSLVETVVNDEVRRFKEATS
jgi:hypothetical protein